MFAGLFFQKLPLIIELAFVYNEIVNICSFSGECFLTMNKQILLVDMQSFYASIEKADNPHLREKPVIVSGDPKKRSGVVLAACPLAKQYGVKNAERLWEAQQKCPEAVIIRPRMQRYLEVSCQITEILETFTDLVEPYSVDEQFLDVTVTQKLFGNSFTISQSIKSEILNKTGVVARVGIGPNKVLAKMACDHFAKKSPNGIFHLAHTNLKKELWPLPIGKMFGVGHRMEKHLLNMGIRQIGHLATFPLEKLKKRWGINGHLLWLTANGIDHSPVTLHTHDEQKAVGHHMTLPRDYKRLNDIKVVLLELSEEVARRARTKHYRGSTVSVAVRGASFEFPTGFNRQMKLSSPTNDGLTIFKAACKLFQAHWNKFPIRSIGVTLSQLQSDFSLQLSLFDLETALKQERLNQTLDHLFNKYGPTSIVRASSLTNAGQAFERAAKIGGHYK